MDDIPVALREIPKAKPKSSVNLVVVSVCLSALGVAALAAGVLFSLRMQHGQNATLATASPAPTTASPSPAAAAYDDTLLGFYAYPAAPASELISIVDDGSIKLRKAAAKAYREMAAAAQQEGISLVPISGFRSIDDQKYLYFEVKAERGQDARERAKVSAPPGYSEHHTGYAIDVGDGDVPATNLSPSFDRTPAYQWLKANAAHYSFELSYPKNNKQGVNYEPWHWRYVGDIQSLKTFYKARGGQNQSTVNSGTGNSGTVNSEQ
ncbi:D-alanyl-D-alanine carboxypeptidase family protein [Kovacikia minuta CCNUW1]|uniref:M15 family metallopeptidase n=1 Tax=Kovacikia minuta TaxID=2931930 RepID=UPI001CCB30B6|nr:M15 family metallopeptidase [Kovacikia minuta]UBF26591.1 D-alanyl-D-alanine carboxypeptidase family protein [Kovacikia minuta CCNUW1]